MTHFVQWLIASKFYSRNESLLTWLWLFSSVLARAPRSPRWPSVILQLPGWLHRDGFHRLPCSWTEATSKLLHGHPIQNKQSNCTPDTTEARNRSKGFTEMNAWILAESLCDRVELCISRNFSLKYLKYHARSDDLWTFDILPRVIAQDGLDFLHHSIFPLRSYFASEAWSKELRH